VICGTELDADGHHAAICGCGGGVTATHDTARDYIKVWLEERVNGQVWKEQHIPELDRLVTKPDGTRVLEKAVMDVVWTHDGQRHLLDVTFVTPTSDNARYLKERASHDGAAAKSAESGKRGKYPSPQLVPFALETFGRPGEAALQFVRQWCLDSADAAGFWRRISAIIQNGAAHQLVSASVPAASRASALA